ncbi:MAG: putative toxin-antitoxin system toxin component, PIN family [Terriglobia bacterium]
MRLAVIDTNVLTGALLKRAGHNREVIRACLEGKWRPLIGQALFLEYEDVLGRRGLFRSCPLSERERQEFFVAFLSVCEWVQIYFSWRPNLPDEGDNHIVERAVAGGAEMIVTNNVRDFRRAQLRFPALRTVSPHEFLKELA